MVHRSCTNIAACWSNSTDSVPFPGGQYQPYYGVSLLSSLRWTAHLSMVRHYDTLQETKEPLCSNQSPLREEFGAAVNEVDRV